MTSTVTRRSATAILTNRKPVSDLVSGLFDTMKIISIFPVKATSIVMEYRVVITVLCKSVMVRSPSCVELELSVEGIEWWNDDLFTFIIFQMDLIHDTRHLHALKDWLDKTLCHVVFKREGGKQMKLSCRLEFPNTTLRACWTRITQDRYAYMLKNELGPSCAPSFFKSRRFGTPNTTKKRYFSTRRNLRCLLGFRPLGQNPAGAIKR